ncbi:ssxt protein containing expressed [Hordeum vulgare]|nr:ssxt protein containing expressed [Hordeum vulgare]
MVVEANQRFFRDSLKCWRPTSSTPTPSDPKKTLHLQTLDGAKQRLHLLKVSWLELCVQYLDENRQLILAILDNKNNGKVEECARSYGNIIS